MRLTEASTRYTLNRTGMELLYMPLPQELRNRIKAFIDICVDRLSRGLGGVLLLLLTTTSLDLGVKGISVVVMVLCVPWIYFSYLARREYVATIRKRFEARRLDFESARVSVQDAATIRLLEGVVGGRQSAPGSLRADTAGRRAGLRRAADRRCKAAASPHPEVREKAYRLATALHYEGLTDRAAAHARRDRVCAGVSPDARQIAREFLNDPDPAIVGAALEALRDRSRTGAGTRSRANGCSG